MTSYVTALCINPGDRDLPALFAFEIDDRRASRAVYLVFGEYPKGKPVEEKRLLNRYLKDVNKYHLPRLSETVVSEQIRRETVAACKAANRSSPLTVRISSSVLVDL